MNLKDISKKRQEKRKETDLYKVVEDPNKPKYYILDMFPYPSGAALHVGHPKGYIATDVLARKKLLEGYNVLHPMGFDTFGLATEQYAIEHKTKPQLVAQKNINKFIEQLEKFGMTYDWSRTINTADPKYFKRTQRIFLQLYHHYYDDQEQKAKPIKELQQKIERGELQINGNITEYLNSQRLAYVDYKPINRCPKCMTGLANEDLDDGKCERCGSIVEQRPMKQWVLRITKYAERLLAGLEHLKREESMKELERNWIGKSEGTEFDMRIDGMNETITVYTTRIDTVFGMSFVAIAPEHPLVDKITTKEYQKEVEKYKEAAKHKTQLERTELQKDKTGVFCGAYAINPFNNKKVPVFVADYVLANYGTGVVMAVPAHDERDFEFAKKYNLPIKQTILPAHIDWNKQKKILDIIQYLFDLAKANNINIYIIGGLAFPFITGVLYREHEDIDLATTKEDITTRIEILPQHHFEYLGTINKTKTLHIFKKDGIKIEIGIDQYQNSELPINEEHKDTTIKTLLGYSGYSVTKEYLIQFKEYLMKKRNDPKDILDITMLKQGAYTEKGILFDSGEFTGLQSDEAIKKMQAWLQEKGIGRVKVHYKMQDWVFSRQRYRGEPFPILRDEEGNIVPLDETELPLELPDVENYQPTGTEEGPLANITDRVNVTKDGKHYRRETNTMPGRAGSSRYRLRYMDPHNDTALVGKDKEAYRGNVDVYVGGAEHVTRHMIYARFRQKFLYDIGVVSHDEPFQEYHYVGLIMGEDGRKMSKRRGNVVNPDDIIAEYGTDALRTYEMFMGPFDQPIAWSTNGIKGVKKFLEKIIVLKDTITAKEDTNETKILLNQTIKKVTEDIDNFRFNTAIAQLMIFVNHLMEVKEITRKTFEYLIILISPFAPHLAEELREYLGNEYSIFTKASWPTYDEQCLVADTITIAVQVNGKVRGTICIPKDAEEQEALSAAKADTKINAWITSEPKKVIYVKGKILNIVI